MRLRKNADYMNENEVNLIASVSDALAHPARVNIFRFIMSNNKQAKKVCNKDIVINFDYAQATISQHVKKLTDCGLVQIKKENKYSYYYANLGMLMQYLNATKKFSVA